MFSHNQDLIKLPYITEEGVLELTLKCSKKRYDGYLRMRKRKLYEYAGLQRLDFTCFPPLSTEEAAAAAANGAAKPLATTAAAPAPPHRLRRALPAHGRTRASRATQAGCRRPRLPLRRGLGPRNSMPELGVYICKSLASRGVPWIRTLPSQSRLKSCNADALFCIFHSSIVAGGDGQSLTAQTSSDTLRCLAMQRTL